MYPTSDLSIPFPKLPLFRLNLETTAIFGAIGSAASELHAARGGVIVDPSSSFNTLTVLPVNRVASRFTFFHLERIGRAGHLEVLRRASLSSFRTVPSDVIAPGRSGTAFLIAGRGQPARPCPSGSVIRAGATPGNG